MEPGGEQSSPGFQMALPSSHALAALTLDDGFKIQEPIKLKPFDEMITEGTISAIYQAGEAKRVAHAAKMAEKASGNLRPIREVIPFTEGRAVGWKLTQHVMSAKARNWPNVKAWEFSGQSVAICGGGPSLAKNLHKLRELQRRGTKVVCINRTQDFLMGLPETHGTPRIKPWASILLEPTPNAAGYIKPVSGVRYYISSQCAPETFDKFEKFEHFIWHAKAKKEVEDCLTNEERAVMVPAMGSTCGMRSIILMYMLGFSDIHLFGMDSCYDKYEVENGIFGPDLQPKLHSYLKAETIHDFKTMVVKGFSDGDREYHGNGNMLAQADEFQRMMEWRKQMLVNKHMDPHNIIVHGSGLLPDIAREYGAHIDNITKA